jgi:hypothetical protein
MTPEAPRRPSIPRFVFVLAVLAGLAVVPVGPPAAGAAGRLTSPKQAFGFDVGADYQLINYRRMLAYWKTLDAESDRLSLAEIGRTAEGRPMVMAIVTSARNRGRLERYKAVSRRLALAGDLTEAQARRLAGEGKAIVWIDGGLHATESLGSQQLIELVWQMVSRDDAETRRILDEVILLAVPANPDGQDLVADWYMRVPEPEKRTMSGVPRLYQKYIGHDNNRDFYMNTQPESEAMSRELYREWHPQIIYNHHQSGPAGTVLFAPPFRDPFNYVFDPLVPVGVDLVAAAMHNRFVAEGKPGAIMRSGARYSTWWNGGLRSTGYFHNIIGILTETIGSPTPVDIPFIPDRILPRQDYPFPVAPQKWHFRQSVDYCVTADKAILDVAARHREDFLYRRYLMGRHAIEKGSRDSWTVVPRRIAEVEAALAKDKVEAAPPSGPGGFGRGVPIKYYEALFDKAKRDPRAFIIPADQPDFPTATKFVNALIKSGVAVHRAKAAFPAAGANYPAGSYVVFTAQAFRAHVLTMFEPQDHPNDIPYPGGSPVPPYDAAGWTLAYQMGVRFDRVLDGFEGPFERLSDVVPPPAAPFGSAGTGIAGWLLDRRPNDAIVAVNRLLKAGAEAGEVRAGFEAHGRPRSAGTIYIPAKPGVAAILEKLAKEKGLNFEAVSGPPAGEIRRFEPKRIGLWDVYGGSMASGWMRWLLEQFEFPHEVVFAPALDEGNLRAKFDVLLFVGGSIPAFPPREDRGEEGFRASPPPKPEDIPEEFRPRLGRVTVEKTLPRLREFVEQGGTILAVGGATSLAYHFGLPVANFLVEKTPDGEERPLRPEKFYAPGSILECRVDTGHPLAFGLPGTVDVFFDNSPVFALLPDAGLRGVRPVAWFEDKNPLRSGWLWGERYLRRGVGAVEATLGRGKLLLFGPEIVHRAQAHGTFKFLFNGIYY